MTTRPDALRSIPGWEALKTQLSSMPLPVFVLDPEGRALWGNHDLFGWRVAALEATALEDVVVEAGRSALRSAIRAVARDGASQIIDAAIPPPSAAEVTPEFGAYVRLALSPLTTKSPASRLVLVIVQDVTPYRSEAERLRRRERLFVDTQGAAHFGVWEWDPAQPSAVWSEELYRIYGLEPSAHTPTYEDYLARVHPEDRARVAAATDAAFHANARYSHDERIYRADGELRHLHTWAEPVLDASGKLVRLVGVCQDITEHALAEEERDRLRDRLLDETRSALRARDDFVAVAARELRTPMTPLLGHLQLLKRGFAQSTEALRFLPSVDAGLKQVKRLVGLMDLLLDVSRIRQGTLELKREMCDLGAVVKDIVESLDEQIKASGCTVDLDLEAAVVGSWDRLRLEEVVTNLVSNAIKFGRGSPVEMRVTQVGDHARLMVRNQGPPIDPATAARIFKPYERGVPVTHYPGLGLGLYIATEIVGAHGGTIAVEGLSERGTTFAVDLPCAVARPASAA